MNIAGKRITILGAVRSGIAAAKLAMEQNAVPFVSDSAPAEKLGENIRTLEEMGIEFETDEHTERVFYCDFIVTSPGVPSNSFPLKTARERGIKVVSELEFASWFCEGKIIAITGTNGKTTTTALTAHVLNNAGLKTYLAGNIGTAFSEIATEVKRDEFVALEVSSFQLDYIEKFKPFGAVILNVTPDHLDRYEGSFDNYLKAKLRITENQDKNDFLVLNADDKNLLNVETDARRYYFSTTKEVERGAFSDGKTLYFKDLEHPIEICEREKLTLKGEHNLSNALSVLTIAKSLGIEDKSICESFESFEGVEHRLEFVRELNGVVFINDSKATNVDSVWYALRSFDKPLRLILGGKDKGNDYSVLNEPVRERVKKIYAIGSSAEKVYNHFKDIVETEIKNSFESAIKDAYAEADEGDIVLLSPACASFDMFDNYEHRGRVFKEIVRSL
jgi:UDP-N-acetylmuramoylalanine--D-glutamate ligase